jgi:hypothetical protein
MTEATRRPCKFCQREIIFVTNQKTGKIVPLERDEPSAHIRAERRRRGRDIASPVEAKSSSAIF